LSGSKNGVLTQEKEISSVIVLKKTKILLIGKEQARIKTYIGLKCCDVSDLEVEYFFIAKPALSAN
jgi:hypothetical protein